jgi:hypothetical protein
MSDASNVAIVSAALDDVYRGSESKTWSPCQLSEPLFTVWAVEKAVGVICNGGSQYFFENDWPEKPEYAVFIDAFRRIGASEAADCLEDAVQMFPSDAPHLDCAMRRDHMEFLRKKEGVDESILDKLGDRIIDLEPETFAQIASYIRQHIDYFPEAKRRVAD